MGFEPTTACLGSKNSTTELHPLEYEFILRIFAIHHNGGGELFTIILYRSLCRVHIRNDHDDSILT